MICNVDGWIWGGEDAETSMKKTLISMTKRTRRGSALVAVFFMIAILGMVMYAGAKALDADSQHTQMMRGRVLAKRFAQMGIELGRHPVMKEGDPLLYHQAPNGGGFAVTLVSEEARLNINVILQGSDTSLLRRLFTRWGLEAQQTSMLIDALKDWVDADDKTSLNGAERRDYEKAGFKGMPFNRPFRDLDEMLLVFGMAELDYLRPDWREWFTVFGNGRVDVNDARPELISLLADVPLERVQPVLTFRAGQDGVLRTMDDQKLTSVPQLAQMLGVFHPKIVAYLNQWVQFQGPVRRIESIGRFGDVSRKFVLITQNQSALWRGEIPSYGKGS
jgi:general secretion pathway protein K